MVASVEAPFAFLQEPVEIVRLDAVVFAHMTLGLVPKILDPVDVILLVCKELRMIDPAVMEVGNIQRIVSSERVRVDDAVRFDLLLDDRQQGLRPSIRNDRRVDLATPLQQAKYRHFAASAASAFAFADTTEVTLISLDFPMQLIARKFTGNQLAQAHEKADRRIGLNADDLSGSAGRAAGHKVLNQLALLTGCKPTFADVHRSHDRTSPGS